MKILSQKSMKHAYLALDGHITCVMFPSVSVSSIVMGSAFDPEGSDLGLAVINMDTGVGYWQVCLRTHTHACTLL